LVQVAPDSLTLDGDFSINLAILALRNKPANRKSAGIGVDCHFVLSLWVKLALRDTPKIAWIAIFAYFSTPYAKRS
jgi:uncharacterized membrane protein